jgi:toxin ParE2
VKDVEFLEPAWAEYVDAQSYYESKVPGLGDDFLAELTRALELLASNPTVGKLVGVEVRSWPLRRFPFSLIYAELAGGLLIIAVAHHHRQPGYWRSRVQSF